MQIAAASACRFREGQVMARAMQMRMNLQRPAETNRGFMILSQRQMAKSLTGRRAEMVWVTHQSRLAIGDRPVKVIAHVADRRSLIPALGKLRRRVNDGCEELFGVFQPAILHGIDTGAKNSVDFRICRTAPSAPENRLGGGG